jgi:hypothetical protein
MYRNITTKVSAHIRDIGLDLDNFISKSAKRICVISFLNKYSTQHFLHWKLKMHFSFLYENHTYSP